MHAGNLRQKVTFLNNLGRIHFLREEYGQALMNFRQALELPNNWNFRANYFIEILEVAKLIIKMKSSEVEGSIQAAARIAWFLESRCSVDAVLHWFDALLPRRL